MNKKLFRKSQGAMLGGVFAGLGDYLGIDPLFIRIFLRALGSDWWKRNSCIPDFVGGYPFGRGYFSHEAG